MTESTLSPDGKWLWNGTEWIPAPPQSEPQVVEQAKETITQVAEQHGLNSDNLYRESSNFDINQDGTLDEYEVLLAANAMANPPVQPAPQQPAVFSPNEQTFVDNNTYSHKVSKPDRMKLYSIIGVTILLLSSTMFWLLSPSISPLSSIHDTDGDGFADDDDQFLNNPTQWADSDGDGYGDNQHPDATQVDNFTENPTQWADFDGDGYGDAFHSGATQVDNFTENPTQWADSDGDGYGDNQSSTATQVDDLPLNPTQWVDSDGDGYGDNQGSAATQVDNFTDNPSQWADSDGDGYGDNQSSEATQVDDFPSNPTQWTDSDGDGFGDNQNSGATQVDDLPSNPTQWSDSDGDGYGDNNALGATQTDAFPWDWLEWEDTDGDGFGDNSDDCDSEFGESTIDLLGCPDWDDDGYSDDGDAFPFDDAEWFDDDEDGIGNNADLLDDGDAWFGVAINFITADTGQSYDFGSAPDMRIGLIHDDECDGVDAEDLVYYSDSVLDDYYVTESDGLYAMFDIEDDLVTVCFAVFVQDVDESDHDVLDYVDGTGNYYSLTKILTGNLYDDILWTYTYYNTNNEYKCVDIEFEAAVI
ncbi:MAG TPA: hypothetical protein EYQ58_04565 [Candidatus Poseidoniales archaeon]|nr:hypothetical protein [Candidatus Poseidoniales archaeon]